MKLSDLIKSLVISLILFSVFCLPWVVRKWGSDVALVLTAASTVPGRVQIYYDTGDGLSEAASSQAWMAGGDAAVDLSLPLPPAKIRALRLDPLDRPGAVVFSALEIRRQSGAVLKSFGKAELAAGQQIASVDEIPRGIRVVTTANADDPTIDIVLGGPLDLRTGLWSYLWPVGAMFLPLFAFVLAQHGGPPRRFWSWLRAWGAAHPWLAGGAAALPLWIYFFWPPASVELGLDASWQQVLSYAYAHDFKFGRELLFTAGPTGFLFTVFATPDTVALKLLWEYAGKLLVAGALVASIWSFPLWRRLAVLLFVFAFASLFPDTLNVLVILLLGVDSVIRGDRSPLRLAAAVALIVFLGLAKFTLLVLGGGVLFSAVLAALLRRRWKRAAALPALWAGLLLLFWLLLGQNPFHLPDYLLGSLELSDGYAWSMMLDVSWGSFVCGALAFLLLLWAFWRRTKREEDRAWALAVCLACALGLYLEWKHGFIRGDGHVCAFFGYAIVVAAALPAFFRSKRAWAWSDLIVPLCVAGFWTELDLHMSGYDLHMRDRLEERLLVMSRPRRYLADWRAAYDRRKAEAELPRVKAEVGEATIDFISFEQGRLLVNELNYRPRPVFQGYSVHTVGLERKNLDFFFSRRAPRYLLVGFGTIDWRYPSQDDALVIANLPRLYEPVLEEKGLLLLRRRADADERRPERRRMLDNRIVPSGVDVSLPAERDRALWLQVFAEPTKLGRLRAFLYKPVSLTLVTTDAGGREERYRLLPRTSSEGFLVHPNLLDQGDFRAFLQGGARKRLRSVRVECGPNDAEFWRPFGVAFSMLPDLPISNEP